MSKFVIISWVVALLLAAISGFGLPEPANAWTAGVILLVLQPAALIGYHRFNRNKEQKTGGSGG